jgi:hypothetical protein
LRYFRTDMLNVSSSIATASVNSSVRCNTVDG